MRSMTPYRMVRDVLVALRSDEAAFGCGRQAVHPPPDEAGTHASMTWQDGVIMMGRQRDDGETTVAPVVAGQACSIRISVHRRDEDTLAERAQRAGAEVRFGSARIFYGEQISSLVDPAGYVWCWATYQGEPLGSVAAAGSAR